MLYFPLQPHHCFNSLHIQVIISSVCLFNDASCKVSRGHIYFVHSFRLGFLKNKPGIKGLCVYNYLEMSSLARVNNRGDIQEMRDADEDVLSSWPSLLGTDAQFVGIFWDPWRMLIRTVPTEDEKKKKVYLFLGFVITSRNYNTCELMK